MYLLTILFLISQCTGLIPPKFQWRSIDYAWPGCAREAALCAGEYVPKNNMPAGIARWRDKLFVTVPRWKPGVPSSLNYVPLADTSQSPLLRPYPSWSAGFPSHQRPGARSNTSVISVFKPTVDSRSRLWLVDNGKTDMENTARQITPPAILVFDLEDDTLLHRYELPREVVHRSSVFTSIIVDVPKGKGNNECTFAYIIDEGTGAILVYNMDTGECWRLNTRLGVSGAALTERKSNGYKDLYFFSNSETYKIPTQILQDKYANDDEVKAAIEIIGERGSKSVASACDFDHKNNILFFTEVKKHGVACWNTEDCYCAENSPVIFSDCKILEHPNDIKVDKEGNIWMLSNRQSRFLNNQLDFSEVNFRVLTAPVTNFTQGTACAKKRSFFKRKTRK